MCCISNNELSGQTWSDWLTLFVRIIPLSCQLQISGSIIYCKHFQLKENPHEWNDPQSFDSEELWHCDIFVTIHYHFNTFSLNIEYIGSGTGGRGLDLSYFGILLYKKCTTSLLSTIHFHFEKLLLETLLAKHRIRILWQIYKLQCRD